MPLRQGQGAHVRHLVAEPRKDGQRGQPLQLTPFTAVRHVWSLGDGGLVARDQAIQLTSDNRRLAL